MAVPRTTVLCTSLRSEQVVIVLQYCHANNILRRFNGRNTTAVLHVNLRAGKRLLIRMHLSRFRNPCHQLIVIQRTGLVAQLQLVHTTIKPNDFPEVGKRLFKPIRRRKMIFLGCYARWWLWIKGGAHGHGPYPITNGERTLLSAWLKQGRDWLML